MNKDQEEKIKQFVNNFIGGDSEFGLHIGDGIDNCSGEDEIEQERAKEFLKEFIRQEITKAKEEEKHNIISQIIKTIVEAKEMGFSDIPIDELIRFVTYLSSQEGKKEWEIKPGFSILPERKKVKTEEEKKHEEGLKGEKE